MVSLVLPLLLLAQLANYGAQLRGRGMGAG